MPPNNPTLPRLAFSETEAGRLIGLSGKTMQRLRTAGKIKYFRATDSDTAKVLYSQKSLEEFIKSREAAR